MHGGDVYRNPVRMDFSVNVNPYGVCNNILLAMTQAMEELDRYPDPKCEALRKALAAEYKIGDTNVICGNGASELLMAVAHALRPRKAMVLRPCFSGYEYALGAVGTEVLSLSLGEGQGFLLQEAAPLQEALLLQRPELLFLTNPNNPNGGLIQKDVLKDVIRSAKEVGCIVLLDECFLPLTGKEGQYSLSDSLEEFPNLLLLGAFTKTFAIPGLRLGYLFGADTELLERIHRQMPEWSVSLPAQRCGEKALACKAFLEESVQMIEKERAYLEKGLRKLGLKTYPSEANFLLFYDSDRDRNLYERMLERGILIRDCREYEGLGDGYYRVAVRLRRENQTLLRILKEEL